MFEVVEIAERAAILAGLVEQPAVYGSAATRRSDSITSASSLVVDGSTPSR